ncbi:MAG TPA: PHB depolymerase family esterase [Phycisphaerales bacterium]|nr:PHB depolymerase family esterase [Phycisphaerales bacterium]
MLAKLLITVLCWLPTLLALEAPPPATDPAPTPALAITKAATPSTPKRMEWTIDGVKREGTIYLPPTATAKEPPSAPVVFGFHGHGGNSRNAARSFRMHEEWPEAIVVYLQGLPTPGQLTDPKGERNGWQKAVGDQSDRDLKFFDAVLADLKKTYKVDDTRIYATGHSNGGAFTYLLWSARPDVFAALAPSAAGGNLQIMTSLKPKPAMHIAGRNDPLVKFSLQQRCMDQVKRINGCEKEGEQWGGNKDCTLFKSTTATPFVAMIDDSTHAFNKNAPRLIVKFFKEHANARKMDPPGSSRSKKIESEHISPASN